MNHDDQKFEQSARSAATAEDPIDPGAGPGTPSEDHDTLVKSLKINTASSFALALLHLLLAILVDCLQLLNALLALYHAAMGANNLRLLMATSQDPITGDTNPGTPEEDHDTRG